MTQALARVRKARVWPKTRLIGSKIRVVAWVVRTLTFDAKGKPNFSPVTDARNIRNLAYELRVRPIAGESRNAVGPIGENRFTDVAQCLERTDAANGEFYWECRKL